MKKLLTILSVLLALSASAQNIHKQSNSNTNEEFQGTVEAKVGFINAHFTDTAAANMSWIKNRPFAQITTGQGSFWLRDATATRWIGTGNATINISPDSSSLIICNGIGSCDTIPVPPVSPITNFTVISDTSIVVCGVNSCDTVYTLPINYNQNVVNRVSVVNGVAIDSVFYFINGLKYLAGTIKNAGTQGSILNDSTFLLCNSNSCDTFIVRNITINSFSFTSDSTVSVCNTAGSCDTITFNPIPLGKFFVDSTKIVPGAVDTLFYWINGVKYIGGFINHLSTVNDGIISGGIVTYSGSGLTYYVSAATYVIGGEFYSSPDTTITLDAADATNPRIDLFAVDTLGHVLKITGIAASTPLTPQVDVSQLALTTGITLAPNATQPTGTSSTLIYDENTEWTTGGTATINFNNTTNPYHGTKDALVSAYSKSSTLTFTGTTQTVNGQVLRAFINLLNSNYSFQFRFYNGTTAVSNALTLNGFGFNPTLYNTYQNVSIPLSSFTWSGNVFDKLIITMTGKGATGTYYIDYISLESGTPVVTPPTDYSNKVDSVTTVNGSIYYWVKGMSHLVGSASGGTASGIDSASYHTLAINSDTTGATLNRPNGTSDFLPLPFVKKTDTTVIKVHYPLWAFTSDSLGLRADSLPKLEYAAAGRDTSTWDNYTLIDKQFLQDRISTVTATGITRTELQDTAAAIRADFPTGGIWGSITGTLSDQTDLQSALDAKQNAITLTTTGTSGAATLTGATLNIPQYTGGSGGTTADSTLTATAGQTAFTFVSVPSNYNDYIIFINGMAINQTFFTASSNTITFTTSLNAGDKVRYKRIK